MKTRSLLSDFGRMFGKVNEFFGSSFGVAAGGLLWLSLFLAAHNSLASSVGGAALLVGLGCWLRAVWSVVNYFYSLFVLRGEGELV